MSALQVFIGWDSREVLAYQVALRSLFDWATVPVAAVPLIEHDLRARGLYWRPHERRDGQLFDVISDAPMSTEFALTRFLVPELADPDLGDWALFVDCDVLFRCDIADLVGCLDDRYAVMCVKHDHKPAETVKMDGQAQIAYGRKNWSSVMAFNLRHPANRRLTVERVSRARGLHLHQFCWLDDGDIGALPPGWNWLVGEDGQADPGDASLVHYTKGTPDLVGFANVPMFVGEWSHVAAGFGWAP